MNTLHCAADRVVLSVPRALLLLAGITALVRAQATVTMVQPDPVRDLGLSVAASGGPRDTLGLLVANVIRNSPADQAGITPGSRILAVNGQPVRLAPNDIGRAKAADSALSKFENAVRVTPSGGDVILRVAGGGRIRNVSLPGVDRRADRVQSSGNDSVAIRIPRATPAESSAGVTAASVSAPATAPAATVANATVAAPSTPPSVTVSLPSQAPAPVVPAAAPATPATAATPVRVSLSALVEALGVVQVDVRRISRDSQSLMLTDSLADVEQEIALLRARLRRLIASSASVASIDVARTGGASTAPTATTAATTAAIPVVAPAVAPAVIPPATPAPTPSSVAATAPQPVASSPAATPAAMPAAVTEANGTFGGLQLTRVSGDLATYLGPQGSAALLVVAASEAWEPMRAGDIMLQLNGAAPDIARLRAAAESREPISVTLLRRGRTFTVSLGGAR
jgi:hypothetical protein